MDDQKVEIIPKHPGGRPFSYKPEYADRLLEFFGVEHREVWIQEKYYDSDHREVGALKEKRPELVTGIVPTFEAFAWEIGVVTMTLWRWATARNPDGTPKYPEFCYAYARAHERQRDLYMRYGGNGTINPAFAMMMLKVRHGFDGVTQADMALASLMDAADGIAERRKDEELPEKAESPRLAKLRELKERAIA